MNSKNKIAFLLIICLFINSSYTFAESTDSLKQQIENNNEVIDGLEDKKENINNEIENKEQEINSLQEKIMSKQLIVDEIQSEISEYQSQIDDIEEEINNINISINENKIEVENRENNLNQLKEEQKQIEELLSSRIRNVYKLDLTKQYIYLLIKSQSVSEIFENLNKINKIISFDKNLINASKENQLSINSEIEEINIKIIEMEENENIVSEKKSELEKTQNEIIAKKDEEQSEVNELYAMEEEIQEIIIALNEEQNEINMEIDDLLSYNAELQGAIDEIFNNINNDKVNDDKVEELPMENGFLRPVNGVITCHFGPRINPVTGEAGFHNGIDYGEPYGVSIKATKSGVVEYAGWIEGYGNTVILNHGNGVQSLYAHAESLNVTYGQSVGQGETVAFIGSTGMSTGPHLHFEIRINGQPVNPYDYIPY